MIGICFLLAYLALAPASTEQVTTPRNTVDASATELLDAYLQWMDHHPEAVPKGNTLKLDMPAIDLYSPTGVSLYYGVDSMKNAAFLRNLPQGIKSAKTDAIRPSLKEAIEMFPALKAQESTLLADKRYTIFAVSYPNWEICKEQNEAVAKLRERAAQAKIRIIEVRLHK
jgi:hypothetical protein